MNLKDNRTINIGWLVFLSVIVAIEVLMVAVLVSLRFPIHIDPFVYTLYPYYTYSVHPERDIFFFRLFVMAAFVAQAFGLWLYRNALDQEGLTKQLRRRALVQGILLSLQLVVMARALMFNGVSLWEWGLWALGLIMVAAAWCMDPSRWPSVPWAALVADTNTARFLRYRIFLSAALLMGWAAGTWPSLPRIIFLLSTGHFIKVFFLSLSLLTIVAVLARMLAGRWSRVWVALALGLQAAGLVNMGQPNLAVPAGVVAALLCARFLPRQVSTYFIVGESILTFLWTSAWFKIIVYANRPWLAQQALLVLSICLVIHKIIFPFIPKIVSAIKSWPWGKVLPWALPLAVFLIIYVPDYEAAVARMFIGEQFHHTNAFIMAPGWSHLSGNLLNVDTISRYGMGAPILISEIAKHLAGGYGYVSVFCVVMWGVILYTLLWYAFFKLWFKDMAWTALVMLLGLRWVFFQTEVYPFIFTYPNATPIRCCWDIAMIFIVWRHINSNQTRWLMAACALAGWAIFYTLGDGIYLATALFGYIGFHLLVKDLRTAVLPAGRHWLSIAVYPALTLAVLLGCYALSIGDNLFKPPFWQNMGEFMKYYSCGFCVNPVTKGFSDGKFMEAAIGLVLPVFYTATALWLMSLYLKGRGENRHRLVIFLALYALMGYHYYAMLSNNTSYYRAGFVIAFLLVFWAQEWIMPRIHQMKWFLPAAIAAALYALLSNHNFISYPNLINVVKDPIVDARVLDVPPGRASYFNHLFRSYDESWKLPLNDEGQTDEKLLTEHDFHTQAELKNFFRQEFNFSDDAALIDRLTSPNEKVALLSSFETEVLIEAKRRPLFFYFELLNARPMHMRMFMSTSIYTKDNLKRTIDQMENTKAPYVFMEKVFLADRVPTAYFGEFAELLDLLTYVRKHYHPYAEGKYLVAMQRNVD